MSANLPGFSANLGFLWTELTLPDAIRAAARAGFSAVECHWPYEVEPQEVRQALDETQLPMLGLNTLRGDVAKGENGLCALPGRERDAIASIDQAVAYASEVGAQAIHVMAGNSSGPDAHQVFITNLQYACAKATAVGITILIEPLNHHDAPDYFLKTSEQAMTIIDQVAQDNLKLMFDCYHLQIMEGDITNRLEKLLPSIGHIQFASVPDRSEPDHGELNYAHIFATLSNLGYAKPLGAEYRPANSTEAGLGWMEPFVAR